jgi:hypothetical protein
MFVSVKLRNEELSGSRWRDILIPIGAGLFIIALIGSATIIPQLRILHFLQALIYIAVIILAGRRSVWGYGAGVSVAVVWNSLSLFVTHLFQSGAGAFWWFLRTAQVERPDALILFLDGIGHCFLMIGCLTAFVRPGAAHRQWRKLDYDCA